MEARSAMTLEMDPYRAGVELADALAPIDPDVVFLFSSPDYRDPHELTEAIHDVLDRERLLLIGCTGEGFLETTKVADVGACALGLHLGEQTRMALSAHPNDGSDSAAALERNLAEMTRDLGQKPDLCFIFCDYKQDGTALEEVFQDQGVTAVGGFAADEMLEMNKCFLYANRQVFDNGLVTLGLAGDFRWSIHLANHLEPVGKMGIVTEAHGTRLVRVDGLSTVEFIEDSISRPISKIDQGIVTLNLLDKDVPGKRYLRSIVTNSQDGGGGLSLFGGIGLGSRVQVCIAQPEAIVNEVYALAERVRHDGFEASAAIIVSCAGRKHLLGNRIEHEVLAIREVLPDSAAIAGFPSFGEFAPLRHSEGGYTATFFHNMTYVLLLLG